MKLVMAIVNNSDVKDITSAMMQGGFSMTKLSSTGGFLKAGTTTLMSVLKNEKLRTALDIIKQSSHSHKYDSSMRTEESLTAKYDLPDDFERNEIVVGGATVFVLNVEESYKF